MFYLEHLGIKNVNGFPKLVFKDKNGKVIDTNKALEKVKNRFLSYLFDLELYWLRIVGFIPFYLIRKFFYLLSGMKISKGVHIHMEAQFFNPRGISIGEGSVLGQRIFLDGRDELKIGKYVDIASEVMIYNSEHNIHSEDFEAISGLVEIGDYCFIGPRAIILPGVKIGRGAVVGAGAVVTRDVEEGKIVGGIPAKEIGERNIKSLNYKLGRSRLFQ